MRDTLSARQEQAGTAAAEAPATPISLSMAWAYLCISNF